MIFDGREFARKRISGLKRATGLFLEENGRYPEVAFVLLGENPEGELFVRYKAELAEKIKVRHQIIRIDSAISFGQLKAQLEGLGNNRNIDGVIIQLPLPEHFQERQTEILSFISPEKDIDGLREDSRYLPAVVKATLTIVEEEDLLRSGMSVAVIGSNGWVGKHLVSVFSQRKDIELIQIDQKTEKKISDLQSADLIISAVGKPGLITGQMIEKGALVIDLGVMVVKKRSASRKAFGDFDFESVSRKAKFVTPVPGGVGPVTVVSLFENLLGL